MAVTDLLRMAFMALEEMYSSRDHHALLYRSSLSRDKFRHILDKFRHSSVTETLRNSIRSILNFPQPANHKFDAEFVCGARWLGDLFSAFRRRPAHNVGAGERVSKMAALG